MYTWDIWLPISTVLFAVLTTKLKGRKNAAALWVYLWLIAAFSAVNAWHAYQNLLSMRPIDLGPRYWDLLHQSTTVFRGCLIGTFVILIYPVVNYWWVARKEGKENIPKESISFTR